MNNFLPFSASFLATFAPFSASFLANFAAPPAMLRINLGTLIKPLPAPVPSPRPRPPSRVLAGRGSSNSFSSASSSASNSCLASLVAACSTNAAGLSLGRLMALVRKSKSTEIRHDHLVIHSAPPMEQTFSSTPLANIEMGPFDKDGLNKNYITAHTNVSIKRG